MANHKSALKRIRSNEAKAERNRYQLKTTRTFIKKLKASTTKKEALELYKKVTSMIDKLAKKNIIHKNNAANKKSKLQKLVSSLSSIDRHLACSFSEPYSYPPCIGTYYAFTRSSLRSAQRSNKPRAYSFGFSATKTRNHKASQNVLFVVPQCLSAFVANFTIKVSEIGL